MLSDDDRAILDFESRWWVETGAKDPAIEHTLGLTSASYYERLLAIVATPDAVRVDPLTVRRVRSMILPETLEEAVS